jgi:HK97 family phage major capsid protein/HK97 family phage prohead protease
MTLKRAISELVVKSLDDDQRIIRGMASTPQVDRMGDIIVPQGARFKNPMPLLLNHQTDQPVGTVKFGKATDDGIPFEATLPNVTEPGILKDRVDEAWHSIKYGLIRAVSVGFRVLDGAVEAIGKGGLKFLKTDMLELSLVAVPANPGATITEIKAYDRQLLAAPGIAVVRLSAPGATGKKENLPSRLEKTMNYAERIKQFETERATKSTRMEAIMALADEEGSTLNAEQDEEFRTLEAEVKSIDDHLKRLGTMRDLAATAKPIDKTPETQAAAETRRYATVKAADSLPKGTLFTRSVIAQAVARGSRADAVDVAKQRWPDQADQISMIIKAAVAPGTTTDATWAGPLAHAQVLQNEFVELLRPETIMGKLNLRRVPFNVLIPGHTQGSTVGWVGQTAPKPVSALGFADLTLGVNKIAGIVVISDELARLSTPSAEALIQTDMIAQIAQFLDVSFIDPASTAISGVRPAAVTVGATVVAASGTDADALRADVRAVYQAWISTNQNNTGAAWVTTPGLAMSIGMIQNPLGQPEFPGLGANGGTLLGLPVIVSESVPSDTAGALLVLIKQSEILLADDGGVTIDVSREASLQMNSAPDNPATAATVMTSLWQNNLVGIRAERYVTWAKRRPQAVAYISGANYGA